VRYSNSRCPQSSGVVSSSLSRRNQFLNYNRRLYSRVSRKEGVSPLYIYTAIHAQGCFHSNYCSLTASGIELPQKIYILRKLEAHFTLISCVCWFDKFYMVVLLYFPPSICVFVPRLNRSTAVPGLMQSWNSGQQLNVDRWTVWWTCFFSYRILNPSYYFCLECFIFSPFLIFFCLNTHEIFAASNFFETGFLCIQILKSQNHKLAS